MAVLTIQKGGIKMSLIVLFIIIILSGFLLIIIVGIIESYKVFSL